MSSVEVWLWLLLVMQPYNPKTTKVLEICGGDAAEAARLIRDGGCKFLSERERKQAREIRSRDVNKILGICSENDIRIITLDDEEYPLRLKAIPNPPIVLFARGSLEGLDDEMSIAVVGTRNGCEYSANVCRSICGELAKIGTTIVSGLAVGLDSVAHRACVDAGGRTVGVLACGMLVNYPADSAQLKRDILASGGALVSELLPHSTTYAAYFQHRNRIISGLASGTLIVEASARSGCLLTAEHTIEQGRDLFCIPPHDISDPRFAGVMPLLRDGAIPVFSYIDIVNEYIYGYLHSESWRSVLDGVNNGMRMLDEGEPPKKKKSAEKEQPAEAPEPKRGIDESVFESLDPNEAAVLRLIAENPLNIDEVIERSGMSHMDVAAALTDLEMFGYIRRNMDGIYETAGG
ncbi:MAG: DNA-processing protein DprA [Oscillospiraceae bacterium]|nr:DNA-processing protein DprA [Oscillospiraceae bacterium]